MPAPLVLDIHGPSVQCLSCHYHYNLRDIGHVEPGVCCLCDYLHEIRSTFQVLREEIYGRQNSDPDIAVAYNGLIESFLALVRSARAGNEVKV